MGALKYFQYFERLLINIEAIRENRPDALWADTWRRMLEHLVINEVDLNVDKATLGPVLSFDAVAEQFIGTEADQTNALLKNDYRSGWKIPAISL